MSKYSFAWSGKYIPVFPLVARRRALTKTHMHPCGAGSRCSRSSVGRSRCFEEDWVCGLENELVILCVMGTAVAGVVGVVHIGHVAFSRVLS
jgi:hypothetical protein